MIQSRLFRTHFAIAAISIFGSVFVGTWIVDLVVQGLESTRERETRQPPRIFVNLVEEFGPSDPVEGLKKLERLQVGDDMIRFAILDEKGGLLYPAGFKLPELPELPAAKYEASESMRERGMIRGFPSVVVVRLKHEPARYLAMAFRPPAPPPGGRHFFHLTFVVMIFMVLLGIAVALWMIFRSLREHVLAADQVIGELQKGNLKARFPIERQDEIGKAKARFNAMADEIERLVDRLRTVERSRNDLLQELAHDLRTPVASLQSIHDSVFSSVTMAPEVAELADLAKKEVEYLGHLVEDLLLLAQLSEPHYQPNTRPLDLIAILEEEADSLEIRKGDSVKLEKKFSVTEALVRGDEHLCRRLVRNALENAFSYAKSSVKLSAELDDKGRVRVNIRDDGPGFDPEALRLFGERRGQRMIKQSQGGRLSLGLGSVIMKSVLTLHRGELSAVNNKDGGATVSFAIPTGAAL